MLESWVLRLLRAYPGHDCSIVDPMRVLFVVGYNAWIVIAPNVQNCTFAMQYCISDMQCCFFLFLPLSFGLGSYVDTIDGSANHLLRISTRMENSADSGGHNTGFRCARTIRKSKSKKQKKQKQRRTDL